MTNQHKRGVLLVNFRVHPDAPETPAVKRYLEAVSE